jgi:MerR family transcriptional regulator, mercuric resistance operon regulatory protein
MASITASRGRNLSIGGLSQRTGVNIETIRYYERIGLLEKPPRTTGGHRSYALEHADRLRFIWRARELGFGIEDIRTLLLLSERGHASCAEARGVAAAHLADVCAKKNDLAKLEKILAETVSQCDAQCSGNATPLCPVLEVLES